MDVCGAEREGQRYGQAREKRKKNDFAIVSLFRTV
jgi:hypothetical protein